MGEITPDDIGLVDDGFLRLPGGPFDLPDLFPDLVPQVAQQVGGLVHFALDILGYLVERLLYLFFVLDGVAFQDLLDVQDEGFGLFDGVLHPCLQILRLLLDVSPQGGEQFVQDAREGTEVEEVGVKGADQVDQPHQQRLGVVIVVDGEDFLEVILGRGEELLQAGPADDVDFDGGDAGLEFGGRFFGRFLVLDEIRGDGNGNFVSQRSNTEILPDVLFHLVVHDLAFLVCLVYQFIDVLDMIVEVACDVFEFFVDARQVGGRNILRQGDAPLADQTEEVQHTVDPIQHVAEPAERPESLLDEGQEFVFQPPVFGEQFAVQFFRLRLDRIEFRQDLFDGPACGIFRRLDEPGDFILGIFCDLGDLPDLFVEHLPRLREQDDQDVVEQALRERFGEEVVVQEVEELCVLRLDLGPLQVAEFLDEFEQVDDDIHDGAQFPVSQVSDFHRERIALSVIDAEEGLSVRIEDIFGGEEAGLLWLVTTVLGLVGFGDGLHFLPGDAFIDQRCDALAEGFRRREDGGDQIDQLLVSFIGIQIVSQPTEDAFDEACQLASRLAQFLFELLPVAGFHQRLEVRRIGRQISKEIGQEGIFGHGKDSTQLEEEIVKHGRFRFVRFGHSTDLFVGGPG